MNILANFFLTISLCAGSLAKGDPIVPLAPGQGVNLFMESKYRCDYWHLMKYFDTQYTNTYCGIASSMMVLNALKIEKPKVDRFGGHSLFTQTDHFFNEKVKKIVPQEQVVKEGMIIEQLSGALKTFDVNTQIIYGDQLNVESLRALFKEVLVDNQKYIIANYHRPTLGQSGGGHFSPIAAYNALEDRVLILDVSRYKYPPVWIKMEIFLKSMQEIEEGRNLPRGLLIVSNR